MGSENVQSFYERMPYPAPLANLDRHVEVFKNPEQRRVRSLLMFPDGASENQDILVAGCGTSQAARIALREPDARIVAIDISATSLGYLRSLKQKYKLDNLELHQLSILDVPSLNLTFDQIICTGVLHHLADPDEGLRSLRHVLKPDGAMQIMVYAAYGRAGIYMLQDYCRLLGITDSSKDLAALSAVVKSVPDDHPLGPLLHKVKDFAHPHALADALLHPQDRSYTVPQLFEWLDRCEMAFGRWMEQALYRPQCGAIAQTPHAARLRDLPEAAQFAAVELFRGNVTQHSFTAYRSDRSKVAQPVRFDDGQWRHYIPVRVPWTKVIRERIPAGSHAVLLNLAHKHGDLFLPIDAAEHGLFEQIDGKRTLGDIERGCGRKHISHRVPVFFQKLWQYDQIVIDASRISDAPFLNSNRENNDVTFKQSVSASEISGMRSEEKTAFAHYPSHET